MVRGHKGGYLWYTDQNKTTDSDMDYNSENRLLFGSADILS